MLFHVHELTKIVYYIIDTEEVMDNFALITGIIGIFSPPIVELFKCCCISKIYNEEIRKTITTLASLAVGILIATGCNYFGKYEMNPVDVLVIGGGVSYTAGQLARRVTKLGKNLKDGE